MFRVGDKVQFNKANKWLEEETFGLKEFTVESLTTEGLYQIATLGRGLGYFVSRLELVNQEVPYDPNQMVAEEDDL